MGPPLLSLAPFDGNPRSVVLSSARVVFWRKLSNRVGGPIAGFRVLLWYQAELWRGEATMKSKEYLDATAHASRQSVASLSLVFNLL